MAIGYARFLVRVSHAGAVACAVVAEAFSAARAYTARNRSREFSFDVDSAGKLVQSEAKATTARRSATAGRARGSEGAERRCASAATRAETRAGTPQERFAGCSGTQGCASATGPASRGSEDGHAQADVEARFRGHADAAQF